MYNNKMNGYAPFRSSGSRMWGMSSSLPSGMDTDFGAVGSMMGSRRLLDMPMGHSGSGSVAAAMGGGGGGGDTHQHHHLSASSTSSLSGHSTNPRGASYNGIGGSGTTNLIINYLPQDMNDRELFSLFRTMGPIESCRIMRDFKTNYSFGYAFINFVAEEGAQRAIKCLNGVTVRNKRLKVSYARPAGEELKDTNLYVTNLPKTIDEEQMDTIFGKYGLIVMKNILRDKITGRPRGVAFIRFNKREEAQEAIAALNNVIPEGGSQPLTVRVAEDHGRTKVQQMFGHTMPQQQQQHQNQQHLGGAGGIGGGGGGGGLGGSSLNMLSYPPMSGMPMAGGSAGHFHHQSNAMHRAGLDGLYSRKKSFPYTF